jgi:uncharacterized membrane protein YkvA (DUF1232 family)
MQMRTETMVFSTWMNRWRRWAKKLKRETLVLYLAYRDPRTPWYAKVFTALVIAYALSPIDLIPDFIPVLGYLDDLILIPAGIMLALKMTPAAVLEECRKEAEQALENSLPSSRWAAAVIVIIWITVLCLLVLFLLRIFGTSKG